MNISTEIANDASQDGTLTDRFLRQKELVPRNQIESLAATVIGAGAIGRHIAMQLAQIGMSQIQLVDFDIVELDNVTTQGYLQSDIGRLKVESTKSTIAEIDSGICVDAICDRFRHHQEIMPVVFCCVDSISARSAIWKHLKHKTRFWCDGRMLGEVIRILTATDCESRSAYEATLFSQSESQQGACTSRSTIYAASVAAGLMVHQFARWLRILPNDSDISFNLLSSELEVV